MKIFEVHRMTVFTMRSKETPEAKKVLDSAICLEPSKYRRVETDAFASLRHHRVFTSCCLLLLILWLLIASFLAGIFFYRQILSFSGALHKICLQYYERISVPRFGSNRPAIFVHDFKKMNIASFILMNLTAIVDVLSNRCFLKDLERNLVAPPKSLIDLVKKMEVCEHRSTVVGRLYENDVYKLHSMMIIRHCARRTVFLLQKAYRTTDRPYFIRDKRRVRKGT
uniref:Integral membrane protein 2 n=1 Tax=Parascaris equorum TaxID=6256 RepID=A0A914S5V8_PAREQ